MALITAVSELVHESARSGVVCAKRICAVRHVHSNKTRSRKCFTKQVKACKQRCEDLIAASWRNYFLTHKVKFSSGWSIRSKMILGEFIT